MSITIFCPFHHQHNLNNFPLNSVLPKPPNSTVHFLLFPSPKFHCPLPNLLLSPNLTTHPTAPPPHHNLTIRCPLPNLHQFHHQLTNLFQISIIQLSTLYLFLPSPHCPLPHPSHHPTVHSLTPPITPLSTPSPLPSSHCPLPQLCLPSSHCPLPNLSLPSSHCPLSIFPSHCPTVHSLTSPSHHPTVHFLISPSHHPTVHSLSFPPIVPLSTAWP